MNSAMQTCLPAGAGLVAALPGQNIWSVSLLPWLTAERAQ